MAGDSDSTFVSGETGDREAAGREVPRDMAARAFAEGDVAGLVAEAFSGVADEMAALIFFRTRAVLLDSGQVRIKGVPPLPGIVSDVHQRAPLVGRLPSTGSGLRLASSRIAAGNVIQLSIPKALEAVQSHLCAVGRPDLRVSERRLLDQIAGLG